MIESSIHAKTWKYATNEDIEDLVISFQAALLNCSVNVEKDIGTWFEKSWPTRGMSRKGVKNMNAFFVLHAKNTRPMIKMSRIGVAAKTILTLFFCYSDLITDALVFFYFLNEERMGLAYATGSCLSLSLLLQALVTSYQYKERGVERWPRTALALISFAPLLEGYNMWKGNDDSDLLFSSPQMYAVTKAIEIAFECVPESIIQANGLLDASSNIEDFQVISVCMSVFVAAFIMMEGNYGFIQSKHLQNPGNPYWGWVPLDLGEKMKCHLGMFLFLAAYFAIFVSASSLLE